MIEVFATIIVVIAVILVVVAVILASIAVVIAVFAKNKGPVEIFFQKFKKGVLILLLADSNTCIIS